MVDQFSDYLIGGKNIVYTDNNPLTYLNKQKKLPAIEQRWANALAPFDLDIRYRSAKHNDNADALSRLQHQELVESDGGSGVEPTMHVTDYLKKDSYEQYTERRMQPSADG